MSPIFATQPRDTRFARRSLTIAGVGLVGLAGAGWLPGLRTPWFVSLAVFATTFGLLSWAAAGSAKTVVRSFVLIGVSLAVSDGVKAVMRGASLREGIGSAAVTALVWAGMLGVLGISEMRGRRAKSGAAPAGHRDQWPNDR